MQLAGYSFVDFQAQGRECAHGAMSSEQCKSAGISTAGLLGCWAVWLIGGQALSRLAPIHQRMGNGAQVDIFQLAACGHTAC
jgi:hypothetical protein